MVDYTPKTVDYTPKVRTTLGEVKMNQKVKMNLYIIYIIYFINKKITTFLFSISKNKEIILTS